MGRPKGGTNKYWTAEEKYEVIKPIINFEKSSSQVTKETGINNGMISQENAARHKLIILLI